MSSPKPLSSLVSPLTKDIMGKKGVLFGRLLMEWAGIAGPDLASKAVPVEIKAAKSEGKNPRQAALHLAVNGSHALEIQHEIPLLLERLNSFFGYKAITGIKLVQLPQPLKTKKKAPASLRPPAALPPEFEKIIATVPQNDLQEALKDLGKALTTRKR